MTETYVLAMRCPVYRRRDSVSGFRTELENLVGDVKGKGTSGNTARPKVPMRQSGADCPVVVVKRSNFRGAKGAGHPRRYQWVNRQREEPDGPDGRRQSLVGGTSRISREAYVRSCERLGVKFPGPTRRSRLCAPRLQLNFFGEVRERRPWAFQRDDRPEGDPFFVCLLLTWPTNSPENSRNSTGNILRISQGESVTRYS